MGASNAGKSTLALAIARKQARKQGCKQARKQGCEVIHLDRLRHLPHTDWQHRPDAEFAALHEAAVHENCWIMDGNYSSLLPQRLARATGVILLTANKWLRIARYLKRTIRNSRDRAGHLEGAQDSLKWGMVDWVLFKSGQRIPDYAAAIRKSGKPLVLCRSTRELRALYRHWDL